MKNETPFTKLLSERNEAKNCILDDMMERSSPLPVLPGMREPAGNAIAMGFDAGVIYMEKQSGISDPTIHALHNAIQECQTLLATYIAPDSGISDRTIVNDLLGVLDHKNLVQLMNRLDS